MTSKRTANAYTFGFVASRWADLTRFYCMSPWLVAYAFTTISDRQLENDILDGRFSIAFGE